jgi:hypothetical protein
MGFMKAPKPPKPTAEETAMVERQRRELDEETEEQEKRLKAVARGTLGTKSLLAPGMSKTGGAAKGPSRGRGGMGTLTGGGLMRGIGSYAPGRQGPTRER